MNAGPSSAHACPDPHGGADARVDASAPRMSLGRVGMAELYLQMWLYASGARGRLLLSSLLLVVSQVVRLSVPWLAARAIDTLQKNPNGVGLAGCAPWVGAIVGASAGAWLLHGPGRVLERSVALRVRRLLTDRLYERLSAAPLPWHARHHSAELAHRLSQASNALANFTQSQFIYLQTTVNLIGPLVALALLSASTGALALLGLMAVGLATLAFDKVMMRLAGAENDAERRFSAGVLDSLSNIGTVLSLRLQETTRRSLSRRLEEVIAPLKRSIRLSEWKWCAIDLLTISLTWGLVTVYAWRAHSAGALLLGSVFMVYQYASQASGVIVSLASSLQNFARMRTDFASAEPIWNAPRSRPATAAAPEGQLRGPPSAWTRIDLCDLCYSHPEMPGQAPHTGLRNASLRLHRGERIALVGASGSGKSTLLRLIAGLYEPSHGHIEIDGVTPLGLRDLRDRATLIPQEAEVFEATVRENIAFDLPYGDDEVESACVTSGFDSVLRDLPLGLATKVVQGGANLSGGQRQRLCLARGVLAARASSVLLLDEPTSALDPLTEARVYDRLALEFPDTCIVASVHRMSLLGRFDRVVLLDKGEIVDSGSADELMQRQPLFRELAGSPRAEASPRLPSAA